MKIRKEILNRGYYANGVFMSVLEEIVNAQSVNPNLICYLQPYDNTVINQLRDLSAEKGYSWQLYASTSSCLSHVSYVADIVGWKHKKELTQERPKKTEILTAGFIRSAKVIAYVLKRANGICELCCQPAPFIKPDGSPYLEVHHWKPLSENGEDTIDNAAALCPNCHKELHFGVNSESIRKNRIKLF